MRAPTPVARWLALCLLAAACREAPTPLVYQAVPVQRRDIVVSAQAAGIVEPDITVDVKSKASGEILEVLVDSGDLVEEGTLLVRIDERQPRNSVALAQAELDVAQARLTNAESQKRRSERLFKSQSIPETEYELAILDYANARAGVIRARVSLENAQIQLDDTRVVAPITGTVIAKSAEKGQVISSPMQTVSEGTVLMRMADLNLVQVRTLVDETDIGKITPGLAATVTVAAYPNRPFEGRVLKIEPQAETQQNVTMFPVLVRIENQQGLLQPGMNCEVEVNVGSRQNVLAIPNAALRTPDDVKSAAQVLGLDMATVQEQLRSSRRAIASAGAGTSVAAGESGPDAAAAAEGDGAADGETLTTPDGRQIHLPPGVSAEQVRAIFAKVRSGERPLPEERQILRSIRQAAGGPGPGGARFGRNTRRVASREASSVFGGDYIVFTAQDGEPVARRVEVGLTDLDVSEVIEGLDEGDQVLLLPSKDLIEAQGEFQQRIERMTGGALPGMRSRGPR